MCCGVTAVVALRDTSFNVVQLVMRFLSNIVNRGDESVGIGAIGLPGKPNHHWKDTESAVKHFNNSETVDRIMKEFSGSRPIAIGHVRYATASQRDKDNAQPHHFGTGGQRFVVASNGDIPFCGDLIQQLTKNCKYQFESDCDAEVIAKQIGNEWLHNGRNEEEAFINVGKTLQGSFSLVAITPSKRLFIMRDPRGFRPLWYAIDATGDFLYVCSESAIIKKIAKAEPIEVLPGELIIVNPFALDQQIVKHRFVDNPEQVTFCLMEAKYFLKHNSRYASMEPRTMHGIRFLFGVQLALEWIAREYPIPDAVCPIPSGGNPAAQGFYYAVSKLTGKLVPYLGIVTKDHSSSPRIFMTDPVSRSELVEDKIDVIPDYAQGLIGMLINGVQDILKVEFVVVIDDSIVRGDQSRSVVKNLRQAGYKTIGFCSTAYQYGWPCFFGLNTPDPNLLIANGKSEDEIKAELGADYLLYLSLEGSYRVLGHRHFCEACFTGNYPMDVPFGRKKEV